MPAYLIDELKNESIAAIRNIVKDLCTKYPYSFRDILGDRSLSNGSLQLVKSIRNRIEYQKVLNKGGRALQYRNRRVDLVKLKSKKVNNTVDDYGCDDFQPGLPVTETEQTQTEKKLFLLMESRKPESDRDEDEILRALEATYPSQRIAINNRGENSISIIFDHWPILRERKYFFEHATTLLGKNVYPTFKENIAANFEMFDIMKYYIKTQGKSNKKKADSLHNVMIEAENMCAERNASQMPIALSLIELLLIYFNENNVLFRVMANGTTDEDVIRSIEVNTPIVIILGTSLYDSGANCIVCVEKTIYFRDSVFKSILIAFLCYFFFGIPYPKVMRKSLEFMQRAFLDINCPGAKMIEVNRKKQTDVDPTVKKLYNKIFNYRTT